MFQVTGDEVKEALQSEATRMVEIERGVEQGVRKGFGLAVVPNRSGVVCLVAGDDGAAHETLLRPHMGPDRRGGAGGRLLRRDLVR
jgi:hypothetical protein